MTTVEIGRKYVALSREGKRAEILESLFAQEVVSVEAVAPPGGDRTTKGLDGVRGKSKWWTENNILHSAEVFGPYPHDDRFAVRFLLDVTNKPSGERRKVDEIGLFTVADGKITREEFFYPVG